MDSTIKGGVIGACAVLAGIALSEFLAWLRANRQRQSERTLIAGALAAELRGVVARWKSIQSAHVMPEDGSALTLLLRSADSTEQNYFSFFEGAGRQLYLLSADLAAEVVRCYVDMKTVFDRLHRAMQILQCAASAGQGTNLCNKFQREAGVVERAAMGESDRVFANADILADRLDAVSAERSLAGRFWQLCCRPWRGIWNRLSSRRRRPPEPTCKPTCTG